MVYVKRNAGGGITAVSYERTAECCEPVDGGAPELRHYLASLGDDDDESRIGATDRDLVRVLEDVVDLLIDKGIILFTELPASAQQKILERRRLRSELAAALDLLDDD